MIEGIGELRIGGKPDRRPIREIEIPQNSAGKQRVKLRERIYGPKKVELGVTRTGDCNDRRGTIRADIAGSARDKPIYSVKDAKESWTNA